MIAARRLILTALLLLAVGLPSVQAQAERAEVRVTVVAILASDQHDEIDPKLASVAREVRKWDETLKGFRIDRTTSRDVAIGSTDTFPLVEDAKLTLTIRRREDDGRICLSIKPPLVGEITYTCKCGKFFPVVTRYLTRDRQRLIVAVMVKPCVCVD
jgi:hypothetical protein